MWCWYYRRRMEDKLAGKISRHANHSLRRHLKSCRKCALEWSEQLQTRSILRSLSSPEPPPAIRKRVMAAIHADPFSREQRSFGFPWQRRLAIECDVAVVMILLALHIFLVNRERDVVRYREQVPTVENVYTADPYIVDLMNDPRVSNLPENERDMLLGTLVPKRGEGRSGQERP